MKVLISADMEGTCGVVSWVQVMPPEVVGGSEPSSTVEYERARARMTKEVNAAIQGALDAGAEEVIVNDSHDGMRNLLPDEMLPGSRYVNGNDKPLGMMQGVDLEGIGCVLYTGYHAKAGTPNAPLAHTWTGWLNDVRINGVSTGEFGINAAVAGHFGVPVTMVAGDLRAVEQVRAHLGQQVVGVPVKTGLSTFAALNDHPAEAQAKIRKGAEQAVKAAKSAKPWVLPANSRIELAFDHQARADQACYVPGVERIGEREVAWTAPDGLQFILTFRAVIKCAGIRMSP